jgi:hypothetical protein
MQSGIGKLLTFGGAGIFSFLVLLTIFDYWDWVPRSCTLSGCPSAYSIEAIYSYTVHNYSILVVDLLGLAIMLGGLRLTRKLRTRDRILPVLAGIAIFTIIFFVVAYLNLTAPATITSVHTVTTTATTTTP